MQKFLFSIWVVLFLCLFGAADSARADFINDPNSGYFQVDFLNSTVGLAPNTPTFINNITFDHTAGTATPSAAGAFLTTTEITPSSFIDYDAVRLTGVIAAATDAQVQIVACDGLATPIAGPFVPVGGIVDISGLGLPNCIQVMVQFNNTPTLQSVEVSWVPLPVLLLGLTGSTTGLVGDRLCYRLSLSNSFVDNNNIVVWVPLPSGLTDAFSQSYDPTFVTATKGGQYTATPTTVSGQAIPANSIFWDIGNLERGTASSFNFCLETPNGTQNLSNFSLQAEANSPTAASVLSDSDQTTIGDQPLFTVLSSNPSPEIDKSASGTVNLPDGQVIYDQSGYSPQITYNISYSNSEVEIGAETIFDPVITDDISDIFAFLGTASPNGCGMGAPAAAFTINNGGVLDTSTPGSEFIIWDFTGSNLLTGGEINVSYTIDYSACFAPSVTDGLSVVNLVSTSSANAQIVTDSLELFFGVDLRAGVVFDKDHSGEDQALFGSLFSFLLTANNPGAVRLDDTLLVDMVPVNAELQSVSIPPEFNATIFYSTCTTPGTCDDPNTPPPMDYTVAPADLDVGANTFWDPVPPADITTVTWVAFYIPCLSSPFFSSPFPSECHVINGSPVPSIVEASMQMRVYEPGDVGFPGANSCDPIAIDNIGIFNLNESGTDLLNADPAAPITLGPLVGSDSDSISAVPALASFSDGLTEFTGSQFVTAGTTETYSMLVENTGNDTALNTLVTIDIPQVPINGVATNLPLISVTGGSIDFSGLPAQVVVNLGDVVAGATRTINVSLLIPQGIQNNQTFNLDASIVAADDDGCVTPTGAASITSTVFSNVSVQVQKTRDEAIITSAGQIHYQLTFSNIGGSPVEGTWVLDKIPDRSVLVEAYTAPAVDSNGNTFTCTGCPVYFSIGGGSLPPDLTPLQPITESDILANFVLGIQTSPGVWEPPPTYASPDQIAYVAYLVDDTSISPPLFGTGQVGRVGLLVQNDDDGPGPGGAGSPNGTLIRNSGAILADQLSQAIGNLVSTVILPETGLRINKSVSDSVVTINQQFSWSIDYTNDTLTDGVEVVITDTLPLGISFISVFHQWNSVALGNGALPVGSTDITADANVTTTANPDGTTTIQIVIADQDGLPTDGLRAADLASLEGGTITINTLATTPLVTGSIATNEVEGCYQNVALATICLTDQEQVLISNPDLFLRKLVDQSRPLPGETINYTLVLSNEGQTSASSVVISDTLPAGVCYGGTTTVLTAGWMLGAPVVSGGPCAVAPSTLTWSGISNVLYPPPGTIPGSSEDIYITYDAMVDAAVPPGTNLPNTALVTTPDLQDPNFPDTDNETVDTPRPDPFVFKNATAQILPGELINYVIRFGNLTRAATTNAYLIDALPDYDADGTTDIQINSIASGSGSTLFCHDDPLNGPTPTFDPLDPLNVANGWVDETTCLGAGYSETFLAFLVGALPGLAVPTQISMIAQGVDPDTGANLPVGVSLDNRVEIFADDDENLANNVSIANTIVPGGDLYISKTGSVEGPFPGTIPGSAIDYDMVFGNQGASELCDIEINITLDTDLTDGVPPHDFFTLELIDSDGNQVLPITAVGADITTAVGVAYTNLGGGAHRFVLGTAGTTPSNDVCIPAGAQGSFRMFTNVPFSTLNNTPINGTATIQENSLAIEQDLTNNSDACSTVIFRADVTVNKNGFSCGVDDDCALTGDNDEVFVRAGELVQYDLTYENAGDFSAANSILYEDIPEEICYEVGSVEASQPGSTIIQYSNDNGFTWTYTPVGIPGVTDCAVTDFRLVFTSALPGGGAFQGEGANFGGTLISTELTAGPDSIENFQAGTVLNLSNMLPAGEGTGNVGSFGASTQTVVDRNNNVSTIWTEDPGARGGEDLYLYRSSTGTIVNLSDSLLPGEGTGNAIRERLAVNSNGEIFVVWIENPGVRGNQDVYLFSSSTGLITNLSNLLPAGEGTLSPQGLLLELDAAGNPFVVWMEATGVKGGSDAYLYSGVTGVVTNLSALLPPAEGTGFGLPMSVAIDGVGNPFVLWSEANGARGSSDAYLYSGATGLVTNLSNLLPPGEGTGTVTSFLPSLKIDGSGNPFASWAENTGARGGSDVYLYSGLTGLVTNLSNLLPAGEGASNYVTLDLALDSSGNPYVGWIESVGARGGSDAYVYSGVTGLISSLSNSLPPGEGNFSANNLLVRAGSAGNVYVSWRETDAGFGESLYLYAANTAQISNISILHAPGEGGGGVGNDTLTMEIDASGNPVLAWAESTGVRGGRDVYFYSGGSVLTNLSNLLPVGGSAGTGSGTGVGLSLSNTGRPYVSWAESTGARGSSDTYLFFPNTTTTTSTEALGLVTENTIVNLSDQLQLGEGTGVVGDNEFALDSQGNPYIIWTEDDGIRGLSDIFLYSGSTDQILNLSNSLPPGEGGSIASEPRIAISSSDHPYVVWSEQVGARGLDDIYLYSGDSGTIINLSDQLPLGEGMGATSSAPDIAFDGFGNPYIVWTESTGARGNSDVYLYSGLTGLITNLSNLLPLGEGTLAASDPFVEVDGTGNPIVVWEEANGARGNTDVYVYVGVTASITNLSNLLLPGEGTLSPSPTADSISLVTTNTGAFYVTFSENPGTRGLRDFYLYSSATGLVTNLSNLLPPGEGTNQPFSIYLTIDKLNNPYVAWTEAIGARGDYDTYLYSGVTGLVTNLSDLLPVGDGTGFSQRAEIEFDNANNPIVAFKEQDVPAGVSDVFLYFGATGTIVDVSGLLPPGEGLSGAGEFDLNVDANGIPHIVFGEIVGARGARDTYYYDGNTNTVSNFSDMLPAAEGTASSDDFQLELTNDLRPIAIWSESTGARGQTDNYIFGLEKYAVSGTYEIVVTADLTVDSWTDLIVDQFLPPGTELNYTLLDPTCTTPFTGLQNVTTSTGAIDISSIPAGFGSLCLRVNFSPDASRNQTPLLDEWIITYQSNQAQGFNFRARVLTSGLLDNAIVNNAAIETSTPEIALADGGLPNEDFDTLLLVNGDLSLDKSVDRGASVALDPLVYTLSWCNNGPDNVDNLTITDTLPALVNYVSDDAGCGVAGQVLTCNLGTQAVGVCGTVTINATVAAIAVTGDVLTNNACVSSDAVDLNPANDCDTATTAIDPNLSNVYISKNGPISYDINNNIVYTLNYGNNGFVPAADVIITDTFDTAELTFVGFTQLSGVPAIVCGDAGGGVVICDSDGAGAGGGVVLAAGATGGIQLTFSVANDANLVTNNEPIINFAQIVTSTPETTLSDNADSTLASPSIPGLADINGLVFFDEDADVRFDTNMDRGVSGVNTFLYGYDILGNVWGPDEAMYPVIYNLLATEMLPTLIGMGIVPGGTTPAQLHTLSNYYIEEPSLSSTPGTYGYSGLAPGVYNIYKDQPISSSSVGSDGGQIGLTPDDTAVPAPGHGLGSLETGLPADVDYIRSIPLAANEFSTANNFAMSTGVIGDFVWDDLDADGIQDGGEPGIPGVTVELLDNGGSVIQVTGTAADGSYTFNGLVAGTYSVRFIAPVGYTFAPQDQGGNDNLDSDANTATGETAQFALAAGATDNSRDAGMYQTASVGNFVWNDLNANGIQDLGEPGANNISVELFNGVGVSQGTTTTNGLGIYSFTGLVPGDYFLEFTPGVGDFHSPQDQGGDDAVDSDVIVATSRTAVFSLTSGENNDTIDAGLYKNARISNFVWDDLDADGIQDVGEPGINNVTVELFDGGGVSQGTTTTGPTGLYSFNGLVPGVYAVEFTLPAGYMFSPQDVGADDAIDSDPNTVTGRTANYTLISDENETSADAGMFQNATIGDFVWEDLDADGIQDGGEPGINNVTVELFNGVGVSQGTTTTNAVGAYSFPNLAPGQYRLTFTLPATYQFSPQDVGGDDNIDSDANTVTGQTALYTLTSGENESTADAGMFRLASVGDFVWDDLDADGIQDGGEPGLNNVTVELLNSGGVVINTTTTNALGIYSFSGLTPAQYRIRVTAPATYNFSTQDVGGDDTIDSDTNNITGETALFTLNSNDNNTTIDSGLNTQGSIGDFVWDDLDADGLQDVGEPGLNAVTVELLSNVGVVLQTTSTSATGAYLFTGIFPGDYRVRFTLPATYQFSPQDVGADDNIDSDANTGTGETILYTVNSGQNITHVDAGMFTTATIGDFVWDDLDADGIQDAGEVGINNVTVELLNSGGAVINTTMTNAAGAYSFANLIPAQYRIRFLTPATYNFSPQDVGADDTIDSDANTGTGETGLYTLTSGEVETSADAGMFINATLGDFVWDDLDADGIQDAGEVGVNNVTVELLDSGGLVLNTTTTNAAGVYSFINLTPGQYRVRFTTPVGYSFSVADAGADDTVDSDANTTTGETALVTLVSGENNTDSDAGMFLPASIGDFVWDDDDADGIQGGPGVAGITVELLDSVGTVLQTTTTDAAGAYSFTGLTPGQYRLRFLPGATYRLTLPNAGADDTVDSDADSITGETGLYTLVSGEVNDTADAGVFVPACIGDFVWLDTSNDGIQDAGEFGANNVSIELLDGTLNPVPNMSGGFITTATTLHPSTGEPGWYEFCGLTPGGYAIRINPPTGYSITRADVGSDSTDSDVDQISRESGVVIVASGDVDNTIDAGLTSFTPPICGECDTETVTSPVRFTWNGFLEQTNILSIQNTCTSFETVDLNLFDINGALVHSEQRMVFPKVQQDIILNDLPGFAANSYGQVEISFPTPGCVDGFLYYYRLEPNANPVNPEVEFAMVLPFKDAQTGTTYTTFNTFQPSANLAELNNLVANWLQITNLEAADQTFTKNIYDMMGNLVETETVVIPAMGRRDLQGGHVNPGQNNIGTVQIVPANNTARYSAQMFRYSGNAPSGQPITAYDYGMAFHARAGSIDCETVNVSPGAGAENWLVVANTDSIVNRLTVTFTDIFGTALGTPQTFDLNAYEQRNISVNANVTSGASAVAEVCTSTLASFITESLFYYRDPNSLSIESAYATQGADGECGAGQAGFNTFWGQTNWLRLTTTGQCQVDVDIRLYDLAGNLIIAWPEWIGPGSGKDLNLQAPPFNLPPDTYGLIEVTPFPHTPGALKAEVVKVRPNANGVVNFATGMPVR